jgi:hypothetical protein
MPNAACGLPEGDPDGCYGWLSGTSMASPTVAGAAALVWEQIGPGATNELVRNALELNSDEAGALGQNMLAWTQNGRLNLHQSVANAGGAPPPPPEPPPAGSEVHVADLDSSISTQGPSWTADITIFLHENGENMATDGYMVHGVWGGDHSGNVSCPSNGGSCVVSSGPMAKNQAKSVTFTVTDIVGAEAYDLGSNHDPDGDSDQGQSITVTRR